MVSWDGDHTSSLIFYLEVMDGRVFEEHAAWVLADYGFKVVIAGSFGDIHYNNELNNGLLPIVQPREVREKLAQLKPTDQVTVDLEQQNSSHQLKNSPSR